MSDQKDTCNLCGLSLETVIFELKTSKGNKIFCCEGCKEVFQMLNKEQVFSHSEDNS